MLKAKTIELEFNKNYGTRDDIYAMLSPNLFKKDNISLNHSKGWQNQFRPVTIFRNKHVIEFIKEDNIGIGLNEIDYDTGKWTSSKLGKNKIYSNKDFFEFLFIVHQDGTCTYKGLWHHFKQSENKPTELIYKNYRRTVIVNDI